MPAEWPCHSAFHGLKMATPKRSKSFTLRVTMVSSCSRAVAAIMPSALTVGNVQWPAGKLCLPIEHAPSLRNRPCHRQYAVLEPGRDVLVDHSLKLRASQALLGEQRSSPAQLTHGPNAEKQCFVRLALNPGRDFASGRGRSISEGMLVSSRNPLM